MKSALEQVSKEVEKYRLVSALAEIFDDRLDHRAAPRKSYFGRVTIERGSAPREKLSAFGRDLSPLGIGLVHLMPIEIGELVLTLHLPSGGALKLLTEILWCKDFGDGWYASGGRFIDIAE